MSVKEKLSFHPPESQCDVQSDCLSHAKGSVSNSVKVDSHINKEDGSVIDR